ncbi:helix-turn-helix transcriptional regulator [Paenibacillus sp. HB172176]|uniref:helix-turn-helix transcriptional regulator n=1 Tax=Paenibacillus sp. HB172176 TaxID=2493690 RepID=UPI00143A0EDD|nr:helix-turn-helix transcriptional regulator [Paenibacillus sp. HB172176]
MNSTYALLLSKYIEKSKLSLGEISLKLAAKNIKVDRSYISKLKNGNKPPASEEITKAIAEITGGDVNKLIVAGQMERLKPVLEELGQEGFEEFLNSIIGYMVSRDHFVQEMNERHKTKCLAEGIPFTPLHGDEIRKQFQNASMDDKIILSQYFTYTLDKTNNTFTVHPFVKSDADDIEGNYSDAEDEKYKRVYEELGFDEDPPKEDELNALKIALRAYRMGKDQRDSDSKKK